MARYLHTDADTETERAAGEGRGGEGGRESKRDSLRLIQILHVRWGDREAVVRPEVFVIVCEG